MDIQTIGWTNVTNNENEKLCKSHQRVGQELKAGAEKQQSYFGNGKSRLKEARKYLKMVEENTKAHELELKSIKDSLRNTIEDLKCKKKCKIRDIFKRPRLLWRSHLKVKKVPHRQMNKILKQRR